MVSGSHCEIAPCDHWTCHDLSLEIQERLGVPVPQQQLIYGGRPLQEVLVQAAIGTMGPWLIMQAGQEMSLELLLLVRPIEVVEALLVVKQNGESLHNVSKELKGIREIVMEAVKQNGCALRYASEELKGDKDIMMEAVKQNGDALEDASDELKGDREVVTEAVKQKGQVLQNASEGLQCDREVVMEAVKQNGYALRFVSKVLKGDKQVVAEAVKQNGYALQFGPS